MGETRGTRIERDEHGRVTDTKVNIERDRRGDGGFGLGILLGVIIIAGAIIAFAYTQGSFQQAGREADQAATVAGQELEETAAGARAALADARAEADQAELGGTESN